MAEVTTPPAVEVGKDATLTDPVWDNADASPDTVQFSRLRAGAWQDVTCAQFRDEVDALAAGLVAAGVQPGARICLMSRTRYEWTLADYALLACGAVTVPVFPTAGPEQVRAILSDSGASGAVVESASHAQLCTDALTELGRSAPVWGIDTGDLDRLPRGGAEPAEVQRRRLAATAGDLATIIYTSGTTGPPKGCVLTHRNLRTEVDNAVVRLSHLFRAGDAATLLFLPLAHAFARLVQFGCVEARARLGHVPDPGNLVADLTSFRPTFLLAIPRVLEKLRDNARQQAGGGLRGALFRGAESAAVGYSRARDTADGPGAALRWRHAMLDRLVLRRLRDRLGGHCTAAISGGAPLDPELAHFFRGAGLTVLEGYGLTETSPAVTVNTPDEHRIGTVGRPLPGVTLRTDPDGEILVRGDVVFDGYWQDPEGTAEVRDGDWLRTGDLGQLDGDGYLTVTGRRKDLLVTSTGKNVSPTFLEDRLRTQPLVSHAMVVGDGRPFVAALVTLDEQELARWRREHGRPADAGPADLRDDPDLAAEVDTAVAYANRAVSREESVRTFRILPRDFREADGELTPTMKVRRTVVHREYEDEINAIYRR